MPPLRLRKEILTMIDYELIRSDRRSLSLAVRDGRPLVRAPRRLAKREIDRFVAAHEDWIKAQLERARPIQAEISPEEEKRLRNAAREYLPGRVEYYGGLMGLRPAGITITGARTRFGSCSSKRRISFSFRLMQSPPEAIDYVVVHELAHLRHMNHSPQFYALIEQYMPDYKARRALLK